MLVKSNKLGYLCKAHVLNYQIEVLDLTFEAIFIEISSILWKRRITMSATVVANRDLPSKMFVVKYKEIERLICRHFIYDRRSHRNIYKDNVKKL